MANFYRVHQREIDDAIARTRPGDFFRVILREPLGPPLADDAPPSTTRADVVTLKRIEQGRPPYTYADAAAINAVTAWAVKYREVSDDEFHLTPFAPGGPLG